MAAEGGGKDKRALFAEWALPHRDYIYTASLYLARNRTEAEDLFQETYLRAYRFFHQFMPGTNCRAWLLTILHNAFKNRYRQQQRAGQAVDFDVLTHEYEKKFANEREGDVTPETAFFAQLLDSEVETALKALPEEYRTTLLLVDVEELTYEEAARVLACPIGTVRSRLSRARRMMQVALRDYAREKGYLRSDDLRSKVR
jgi:RNA polymerase sigma-70 factor, ECF subfamily